MPELNNSMIDLIVTSPPYWHIKNYKVKGQIGYDQSLHDYLKSLYLVWEESFRVLKPGSRLCVNIGDQFLRSIIYGKYKVSPLHAEIIAQCEQIGFDYMGSIIWQKKTKMNTTGGATVMGSYPYPPNGLIEFDYEFILIFKKPGQTQPVSKEIKERSKLTKEEWKEYFSGHWNFNGTKQIEHEAMFPEELPKRLIKMFSFVGDTILDPFLGSGTTAKVANELERNAIGYEINPEFLKVIKEKIAKSENLLSQLNIEIIERTFEIKIENEIEYRPNIKDAKPVISPEKFDFGKEKLYKVVKIINENTIELDTGLKVKLLGIIPKMNESPKIFLYLNKYLKGKFVYLKFDTYSKPEDEIVSAYVFLKNKIFINKELVKLGMADVSNENSKYRKILMKAEDDLNV
ncbi:MAG: DNA methyltransferase [Athalassotoga sp.]|uniref:Methyltransferase n=2 Tax=Bacteria TaxID=2 RepID=A0A2J6X500_9BACT|nr:MAG: DNA methylase N-4 [Caldisericum exile]